MATRGVWSVGLIFLACLVFVFPEITDARQISSDSHQKKLKELKRVLVLDGSPVHNVGEVVNHEGNWGMLGSMPGSGFPFSFAPSAEWPAGSGVEHLFVAGLWVAAIKSGVPAVSTSAYEFELRPTDDPIDVVYRSVIGDSRGKRIIHFYADDDADGLVNEDWLDGHDNDNDGLIDEDFAAISNQMFSYWYTDDQPIATQIYPMHNPLPIMVRQETYQWEDDRFDDFVGIEYKITNIGMDVLEDIYIGIFADPDIGRRNVPLYWEDDATGHHYSPVVCTDLGPVPVDIAYAYDEDGDGGSSPGYIGIMFLGHTTDPTGQLAPPRVGIRTYANFSGDLPFDQGGDPTNDFERYELLSSETIERDATVPRDYRMIIGTGSFNALFPGSTLVVQAAVVMGSGLAGLIDNAASAQLAYNGLWLNIDGNPVTGIVGRETLVHGPATVVIDSCIPGLDDPVSVTGDVWINNDCSREEFYKTACMYGEQDSLLFRTGVGMREQQVHWLIEEDLTVSVSITGFMAEVMESGVKLIWDISSDENIKGFKIYRQAEGKTAVKLLNFDNLIPPERREYIDKTAIAGRTYLYRLGVVREDHSELLSNTVTAKTKALSLMLHQNFPNPFNPSTSVAFTLPEKAHVKLAIYDLNGKLVKTLLDENISEGYREVEWNGRDNNGIDVASGIYFARLEAGGIVRTRTMVHLK